MFVLILVTQFCPKNSIHSSWTEKEDVKQSFFFFKCNHSGKKLVLSVSLNDVHSKLKRKKGTMPTMSSVTLKEGDSRHGWANTTLRLTPSLTV